MQHASTATSPMVKELAVRSPPGNMKSIQAVAKAVVSAHQQQEKQHKNRGKGRAGTYSAERRT